jgi:hypothetical protein
MGRHDPAAQSRPPLVEAFASFVKLERELLALVETSIERGEQMLARART